MMSDSIGNEEFFSATAVPIVDVNSAVPPHAEWDATVRNRNIGALCDTLEGLDAVLRGNGKSKHLRIQLVDRIEKKATRQLSKACGACGLQANCELSYDLQGWKSAHPSDAHAMYGIKSRVSFLRGLKIDPQASCEI